MCTRRSIGRWRFEQIHRRELAVVTDPVPRRQRAGDESRVPRIRERRKNASHRHRRRPLAVELLHRGSRPFLVEVVSRQEAIDADEDNVLGSRSACGRTSLPAFYAVRAAFSLRSVATMMWIRSYEIASPTISLIGFNRSMPASPAARRMISSVSSDIQRRSDVW